ncbi:glutamate ABC transporter substrate-binding protein [Nocardioides jiangxiensis]|uniref:Glutamate ABC transporter substrate-binding protein n=1 Tax=Nocardioides jiangxiensis TaxID=3064524 RepID=A0ABT9AZ12_9ACTN|nr:glutamate ABC transporter substrate-binding protein [Nocardioides sp. WY-20]MDO7867670.1 glutamate ABC transporter substrate-binding protein [Nocardioides sp. WY-20]
MHLMKTKAVLAACGLALSMAACGNAGGGGTGKDLAGKDVSCGDFTGRVAEICKAGKITIGVKFDQPGLGFKSATADEPEGFDVEVAKILAADLGIDSKDVKWVETISDNREPFLQAGKVDLVLASYSITPERRKVVGQAGPYMVTGQQLLVPADSTVKDIADLKGKEVCSVTGSTSIDKINEKGAKGVGFESYSECVQKVLDGTVEAMSTDGTILAGFAAQNEGQLKVVGDPFSEERIGVGYSKDAPEMCTFITDSLKKAFDDGTWAKAFEDTLGPSGVKTPDAPMLDTCQS